MYQKLHTKLSKQQVFFTRNECKMLSCLLFFMPAKKGLSFDDKKAAMFEGVISQNSFFTFKVIYSVSFPLVSSVV